MATASSRPASPSPIVEKATDIVRGLIAPVICTVAVLAIWEIMCRGEKPMMPGPSMVFNQTQQTVMNGFSGQKGIWSQLLVSLRRVAIGYSFAAILGIIVGTSIGVNKFLREGFDPMIQVLRTVPPLAWLPISSIIFIQLKTSNPAEDAGLFLIFITSIWPIIINTSAGVQQIPKDYMNVAKVLRLSGKDFFLSILVPSTVPYVFTGLKIGIGLAWLAIVAAEMVASSAEGGIGAYIWGEYNNQDGTISISKIILAVFSVGLVGLVLDRFVGWLGSLIVSE